MNDRLVRLPCHYGHYKRLEGEKKWVVEPQKRRAMAYDNTHLVKLAALKALAEKVKSDYALKTELSALSDKVDNLVTAGGEPNKLEGVKVNGTALAIAEKMVDILITTGSANGTISVNKVDTAIKGLAALAFKAKVSQTDLDEALAAVLAGKADAATTLAGYGITDAYTKDELNAKISAVYKPAGSVAFADLPELAEGVLGNVYNVTNAFTTTDSFVEGTGNKYPKDTNVVVIKSGEDYKFDVLAGFVDLSGKVDKEDGKGLSANDFTDALKAKLDAIAEGATKVEASETNGNIKINGAETKVYTEPSDVVHGAVATDDEVTEMLNEVFTTTGA